MDAASWRWVVLINVPIRIAAVLLCRRLLPHRPAERAGVPSLDWFGLAQLSGGAALVVLGCTLLGDSGSPTWPVAGALGSGVLLLTVFAARALRVPAPLVDLRLLRHRPLAVGLAVLVPFGAAYFGAAYFGAMSVLPLFVQGVRGDPATLAGVTLGLLGSLGLLAATSADAPYPVIVGAAVVLGIGSGATLMPRRTSAVRDLEGSDTPRGTTLLALAQQLAGAVGAALVATAVTLLVSARVPGSPGPRAHGPTADGGGVAGMLALEPEARTSLAPQLAAAVGGAYAVAAVLMALSAVAAVRGLRPSPAPRTGRTAVTGRTP